MAIGFKQSYHTLIRNLYGINQFTPPNTLTYNYKLIKFFIASI